MSIFDPEAIGERWKATFFDAVPDWRQLIEGVTPKDTDCGPVYELDITPKPDNESVAIADMRLIDYARPHYHKNGETEIYIVLQGAGVTVVGYDEIPLEEGTIVVTPPETAHFTVPAETADPETEGLVLAVINTPPFEVANNVSVDPRVSNGVVHFNAGQLLRLTEATSSS